VPRKEEHLAKAQYDERFAASLDVKTTPFADWIVTALFYAALHYVEAYFATLKRHSGDHRARDSAVWRDPQTHPIYVDYCELKNFSINARYFMQQFNQAEIVLKVQPCLISIKGRLLPLL
jgi:hypothetical protein